MGFIIFCFITFGITNILTQEYVFKWLRKLIPYKPITCPTCMSFWIGGLVSIISPDLLRLVINDFFLSSIVLYHPILFIVSGAISYTFNRILHAWLNSKGEITIDYD